MTTSFKIASTDSHDILVSKRAFNAWKRTMVIHGTDEQHRAVPYNSQCFSIYFDADYNRGKVTFTAETWCVDNDDNKLFSDTLDGIVETVCTHIKNMKREDFHEEFGNCQREEKDVWNELQAFARRAHKATIGELVMPEIGKAAAKKTAKKVAAKKVATPAKKTVSKKRKIGVKSRVVEKLLSGADLPASEKANIAAQL